MTYNFSQLEVQWMYKLSQYCIAEKCGGEPVDFS